MATVVKREGHTEPFDEEKLYASVFEAAASALRDVEESEEIAEEVAGEVAEQVTEQDEIASTEIKQQVCQALAERDEEVSFFYDQHVPNLNEL